MESRPLAGRGASPPKGGTPYLHACRLLDCSGSPVHFQRVNLCQRLKRQNTVLAVVDVQERLLPAMFEKDRMLQSTVRLVKGANLLGVPMLVTEQYKKGLGPTVPELAGAVPNFAAIEKLAFSACEAVTFRDALAIGKRSDVVLCGIEAHVCVSQTCLELLEGGYRVFVVADAVSSRTAENCRFGLDRMRQAGAVVVSTEMVLFELLEQAGTAEFKQVLGLVK